MRENIPLELQKELEEKQQERETDKNILLQRKPIQKQKLSAAHPHARKKSCLKSSLLTKWVEQNKDLFAETLPIGPQNVQENQSNITRSFHSHSDSSRNDFSPTLLTNETISTNLIIPPLTSIHPPPIRKNISSNQTILLKGETNDIMNIEETHSLEEQSTLSIVKELAQFDKEKKKKKNKMMTIPLSKKPDEKKKIKKDVRQEENSSGDLEGQDFCEVVAVKYLLGDGERKAFRRGINWLSEYPLLRDSQTAQKIFELIQESCDVLGNHNCYLNLSFALLESLKNSGENSWENFLEILHDCKNPDLLEFVEYILKKKSDSFHITRIPNALYDNLPHQSQPLPYLTLFRLALCKKQLSRSLILFFQNMLSYRYWTCSLGYRMDIFIPSTIHEQQQRDNTAPTPSLSSKITPTLTQLMHQSIQRSPQDGANIVTKTMPCDFQNLQAPLIPENEQKFWQNHYVFLTTDVVEQEEAEDTQQATKIYHLESGASQFLRFTITQSPNLQEQGQDLHVFDLLHEFSQQKSIPSRFWTGMDHTDSSPPISFFTYSAATGQIRLTNGVNFLQSLSPSSGQLISQTLPANAFIFPETFLSNPHSGVIVKAMMVELSFINIESPPPSANLQYHLVTPELQPYLHLETPDILPNTQTTNPNSHQKRINLPTLDLFSKLEKAPPIVSATLINQFFLHQGFLFAQPTLTLKDLLLEQPFKITLKWESLEGAQDILSYYTLAAYLHSLVYNTYNLYDSNLKFDADKGNAKAQTLLTRLHQR